MTADLVDVCKVSRASIEGPDVQAALAAALVSALATVAGQERAASLVSIAVEFTATAPLPQTVSVEARVERSTRTLSFLAGEARDAEDARLAVASAVFRVLG